MGQVDVRINGHNYSIACDDGQEGHVRQLADYVDGRVQELVNAVGQVGESRLLVMSSLMVADELAEAYSALERNSHGDSEETDALADAIEALAERIEGIAAALERA